jgi:hypothetical protein
MNYPLPVVAEKGKLQHLLGLDPIPRTSTHSFPHGKVVLRTHRLPTKTEIGSVGIYYTDLDGYRAMFEIRPTYDWTHSGRTQSDQAHYLFKTGFVKESNFDALIQTIKMIYANLEGIRKPRSNEID